MGLIYEPGLTVGANPGAARSSSTPEQMMVTVEMLPAQRAQHAEPIAIILYRPKGEPHTGSEDNDFQTDYRKHPPVHLGSSEPARHGKQAHDKHAEEDTDNHHHPAVVGPPRLIDQRLELHARHC